MSLTFTKHRTRLDLFVHEILFLAIADVLIFDEVEVVAREKVEFILHLPDLGLFYLGFSDGQGIGFAFCPSQVRLIRFVKMFNSP